MNTVSIQNKNAQTIINHLVLQKKEAVKSKIITNYRESRLAQRIQKDSDKPRGSEFCPKIWQKKIQRPYKQTL